MTLLELTVQQAIVNRSEKKQTKLNLEMQQTALGVLDVYRRFAHITAPYGAPEQPIIGGNLHSHNDIEQYTIFPPNDMFGDRSTGNVPLYFGYIPKNTNEIEFSRENELSIDFRMSFSDEYENINPSAEQPIETLTMFISRGKGAIPWKLPTAPYPHANETTPNYIETINPSQSFGIKIDMKTGKVIQSSNSAFIEEDQKDHIHIGATQFGIDLIRSAIQIADTMMTNSIAIMNTETFRDTGMVEAADNWWKSPKAQERANDSLLLKRYPQAAHASIFKPKTIRT